MLRRIVQFGTLVVAVTGMGAIGAGCLDRPITSANPTTKTNFTVAQQANSIDKVDLLFDIDNSASMGDKQVYLEKAVPDLITRLVQPNCVDATTGAVLGTSMNGSCTAVTGSQIEFPPVHNMHIGIISSSLGTRGVTGTDNTGQSRFVCNPSPSEGQDSTGMFADGTAALNTHVDDRGELLSRSAPFTAPPGTAQSFEEEVALGNVGAEGFLDWFPTGPNWPANAMKTATEGISAPGAVLTPNATALSVAGALGTAETLEGDFGQLVAGVHTYGCGIESQLESWYRFLVQPDPYDSIQIVSGGHATWSGVDKTIIQQRHDFLRPDSLVAIIVLTDENDSEIDVRSVGGEGYLFMDQTFAPPRSTSACATDPGSGGCQSCPKGSTDPNCVMNGGKYSAEDDPAFYINVRHVHMQQKYGFSPQFPLQRYVLGLTSQKVPDRIHEYPAGAGSYEGGLSDTSQLACANPLFAGTLPNGTDLSVGGLCNATNAGTAARSSNLVFYAHIGGVPHELLQYKAGDKDANGNVVCTSAQAATGSCPQKDALTTADWTTILGAGAAGSGSGPYDYSGINPHMIEAHEPTRGVVQGAPANSGMGGGSDPINGRDWVTDGLTGSNPTHTLPVDREYACIFPLTTPRDCSQANDPLDSYACDCAATGLTSTSTTSSVPAVCGLAHPGQPYVACANGTPLGECPSGTNDYTTQYYAKTYPTIRELTLAEMMGSQGIISSLCPIHVTDQSPSGMDDPLYGYRPAIGAIVNRLKNALASQCLPQPLNAVETDGGLEVPCLILATLPKTKTGDEATACKQDGLSVPSASVLAEFNANQHALAMSNKLAVDLSTEATCQVAQLYVAPGDTCVNNTTGEAGWCYVTGKAAGACNTQAILFTAGTPPNGATVNLQCILANATSDGGGGG
jgi:hypothetical protein